MRKTYNKKQMVELLTGLKDHLSNHTSSFPALSKVVKSLDAAIKDPTKGAKASAAGASKKVTISYDGGDLLVKDVPWGQVGLALKLAFNRIVGKPSKKTDESGEVIFLSCYSRADKAFRVPSEKLDEVMTEINAKGLEVQVQS